MTQCPSAAQGDVNGLATGVEAADRLEAQAVLANGRGAAGVGAPREAVGGARVGGAGAGGQGGLGAVCVLTVERAAAAAAQDAAARGGL